MRSASAIKERMYGPASSEIFWSRLSLDNVSVTYADSCMMGEVQNSSNSAYLVPVVRFSLRSCDSMILSLRRRDYEE